jgi:hypothetical protein
MANHLRSWAKERAWRQRLAAWQKSRLTGRDFCRQHSLSEASFYAWRRVLAQRDREAASLVASKPAASTSRRRRSRTTSRAVTRSRRRQSAPPSVAPASFVPVEVCSARPLPQGSAGRDGNSGSGLEVVLASGRTVRIGCQFDAATLVRLLAVLEAR